VAAKSPILASMALLGACVPAETGSRYAEAGRCGGPPPGWLQPSDGIGHHRLLLSVRVDRAGSLHWNGPTVSMEDLARYLEVAGEMNPRPQIALVVDEGADCRTVAAVRRQLVEAAICSRDRLCGEGRFRDR